MKYHNICKGKFISRPNRFIAHVEINGEETVVHVKNTGRCRELLTEHAVVYLEESKNPARKTKYDLVAVEKKTSYGTLLINMDSQAPNYAVKEWLLSGKSFLGECSKVIPEYTYGNSRFDFCVESGGNTCFIEVKGVTLEEDGILRFPDAPTLRGLKHIYELIKAKQEGYDAAILFVIQMKDEHLTYFEPNDRTQPEFRVALRTAREHGVKILAVDCDVTTDSMTIGNPMEVRL